MPKFPDVFTIIIITSIYSLEITKFITFPAIIMPQPHTFLWIAPSISAADVIIADGAKTFLSKEKEFLSMIGQIYQRKH